jgi:hypothetical protein
LAPIAAVVVLSSLGGCGDPSLSSWWFEVEDEALRARVVSVSATILRDGCGSSTIVFRDQFRVGRPSVSPPPLDDGRYGFVGRAFDAECRLIASGCSDVTLPAVGVTVQLQPESGPIDPTCVAIGADAGMPDGGAAPPDGGSDPPAISYSPLNVDPALFVDTGAVEISSEIEWDTDDCSSLPGMPRVVASDGGPELCVQRARTFEVSSGGSLRVVGARPLVWLAFDSVTIQGTVDLSAHGRTPGAGGAGSGAGPSEAGDGGHVGTYDDGGGGGGGACGAGGEGGRGDAAAGGSAGPALDSSEPLVPLRGGSGGGRGGSGESAGAGGAGGGAFQISAGGSIAIAGSVFVSGGGGAGGEDGTGSDNNVGSGGGGGSGGSLLVEAPAVTLNASARLVAAGGGGGGAGSCRAAGDAEDGEDGRVATFVAEGGSRGAACASGFTVGTDGGNSGGGTALAGLPGGSLMSEDGMGANGAGGGGGAGCILIRSVTEPAKASSRATPSAAPGFRHVVLEVVP